MAVALRVYFRTLSRIMSKQFRIAGINFDHFHMGDLLRMTHEHPDAEIVGICDAQPERMREAQRNFSIPDNRIFTDVEGCMEKVRPDVVILCPAAAGAKDATGLDHAFEGFWNAGSAKVAEKAAGIGTARLRALTP